MEGRCRLKKTIPELQAEVSLMMLSKNLLFNTVGFQITYDFVWKSKAAIHSFTLNLVKLFFS